MLLWFHGAVSLLSKHCTLLIVLLEETMFCIFDLCLLLVGGYLLFLRVEDKIEDWKEKTKLKK